MNDNKPKISIITPAFNAESNILNYLKAISSQTFKDFELIIIDGGSTDRTLKKINKLSIDVNRLIVISEPDSGVYDAMNKGMRLASGDWVYFLGTDDTFSSENSLERVFSELDDVSDLVYGKAYNVAKGRVLYENTSLETLLLTNICHQAIFYRRTFAQKIGYYDLLYKICSDWDYNIRCFSSSPNIKYIDYVICNYGGDGLSSKQSDTKFYVEKYKQIRKHTKKMIFTKIYSGCRHDFYFRAMAQKEFSLIQRMGYLALFAFHTFRQKVGL